MPLWQDAWMQHLHAQPDTCQVSLRMQQLLQKDFKSGHAVLSVGMRPCTQNTRQVLWIQNEHVCTTRRPRSMIIVNACSVGRSECLESCLCLLHRLHILLLQCVCLRSGSIMSTCHWVFSQICASWPTWHRPLGEASFDQRARFIFFSANAHRLARHNG